MAGCLHAMELASCSTAGRLDDARCYNSHAGAFTPRRPCLAVGRTAALQLCHKQQQQPLFVARAASAIAASAAPALAEDKWIAQFMEIAATSSGDCPAALAAVRSSCMAAATTLRMPTTKNEEYRFTDVAPLLRSALQAPSAAPAAAVAAAVAAHRMKHPVAAAIVLVDGQIHSVDVTPGAIPAGGFVGRLAEAPADVVGFSLGAQSRSRGGPFATLNGALARDAVVVHLPAGANVTHGPIHVLHLASSATAVGGADGKQRRTAAAPRLLVVLEEDASAEVIEEFAALSFTAATSPGSVGDYLVTAVAEVELDDRAQLKHSYVVLEAAGAAHMKATLVTQGKESRYVLTEARVGGGVTRHDLGVTQLGAATQTQLRSFLLAGDDQLHDLHSKLTLDHPDGSAEQLHKCIAASATAKAVFDGNVRVNRLAQRTDAQQLSRNLLLVPRATVNVKPNLQIVADDVKCTHGCAVSDLAEEELFYLRSRGIDAAAARQVLVYSFGREVVQHLRDEALMGRVESASKGALAAVAGE